MGLLNMVVLNAGIAPIHTTCNEHRSTWQGGSNDRCCEVQEMHNMEAPFLLEGKKVDYF